MDKSKLKKKIANELFDLLIALFPAVNPVKSFIKLPFELAADKIFDKDANIIRGVAKDLADELCSIPEEMLDNIGSAQSAAWDIGSVIKAYGLNADKLIACQLNKEMLRAALVDAAEPILDTASAERRGLVLRALETLADRLIDRANDIPDIQVAFMRAMLSRGIA